MEHDAMRHKLSEYLDGSITARERAEIEEHLKTCQQCTDALKELQKTVEHIKTIDEVEPPSWITRKIMAKVRAEAEKRNLFQRLFYPLAIKLPIQAVAVLFLAVTAFYIYQNIQPAQKYAEAPMVVAAKKDELSTDRIAKEKKALQAPARRAKQVPQSPGYKALDMKLEYEKPAPPKPAEQPVPGKKEAAVEERFAAPQAGAPAMIQEQTTGAATEAEAKLKSPAASRQALNAVSADKAGPRIVLRVKDVEAATREVEQAIAQLGGSITRKEGIEKKKVFAVKVDVQKLQDLRNKLKLIGKVKDEAAASGSEDSQVELRIELVPDSTQP